MSKCILLSIKPQHVAKILNGEKTIEIRKKFPKDYVGWVYIYCTKENELVYFGYGGRYAISLDTKEKIAQFDNWELGNINDVQWFGDGKVVARFWCDKVEEIICRPISGEWECYTKTLGYSEIAKASCLENREVVHYLKDNKGYAIHITNLEIFDKPKEIGEFHKVGCEEYFTKHVFVDHPNFRPIYENELKQFQLTRAPESYCYIEIE